MLLDWKALNRTTALLAVLVFAAAPIEVLAVEVASPDAANEMHRTAFSQYTAGEWSDAAASFHDFAAKFPSDPRAVDAVFLEAEALHADKQYATATLAFGEYLRRAANRGTQVSTVSEYGSVERAMFRRGESAFFAGQNEAARDVLTRFRTRFPDHALIPYADRLLSDVATQELERFVAPLRSAQNDVRDDNVASATQRVKETLSSGPPEPIRTRALYLDGQIAALRGDWENACTSMASCLAGELGSFSPAEIAEAHFWYAESLFRRGGEHTRNKPPQVQQAFEAAANHAESKWAAMITLRLAQLQADRGEWSAAMARAESIAATYPDFELQFEVDHLIGQALADRGEFNRARAAFRRSIANPHADGTETAAIAQLRIGEAFLQQKRFEEALTEFLRLEVLHKWPQSQAFGVLQAGECYEHLEWRRSAIEAYTRVISDYSGSPAAKRATERLAEMNDTLKQNESATAGLTIGRSR